MLHQLRVGVVSTVELGVRAPLVASDAAYMAIGSPVDVLRGLCVYPMHEVPT